LLLQELWVDEDIVPFLGCPRDLPLDRFPQAVALAIALRHSWRDDDLARIAGRLGVTLGASQTRRRV
jgi:hypothetical protein